MAGTNQFKAFATGGSAYTLTAADYAALTDFLANGFPSGIVDGARFNTVLRQVCMIAAAMGKIVSDANLDAMDNGNVTALAANIYAALRATLVGQSTTITAGSGLTGGGGLNGNITLNVGTPATCSGSSGNAVTEDSHSHSIAAADTEIAGVIRTATVDEALALSLSNVAITPKTLERGMNYWFGKRTFSANDYIRIPDVSGGQIRQCFSVSVPTTGSGKTATFPVSFPNYCRGVFPAVVSASTGSSEATVRIQSWTNSVVTFSVFDPGGDYAGADIYFSAEGY